MAERTIPIFPCVSIHETEEFYRALGFATTSKQTSPNPFIQLSRGGLVLQFYGWKKHDPAASMHMCYVVTTDVDELYEAFRSGLKEALGRVPARGLPRIGVLKDMTYGVRQFLMTDPNGVQLRVGQPISDVFDHGPVPEERVARALHMAVLMADSKEDLRSATTILDRLLASGDPLTGPQRVQALVMSAEVALRREDEGKARAALAEARAVPLDDKEREGLRDELRRLADLEGAVAG
ncbi:bleomycin resistance protein [Actinomadura hibisca]|uniref:bleomycin resistance protein n=1 Tax=Actinomadura hibisca TaxID=68565 RepID=UPI00082BE908|nr:VOC family protein [Actinomadura hibisca]